MSDRTQKLTDELVALRRECLALRLENAQLRDVLRQREAAQDRGEGIETVLRAAQGQPEGSPGIPKAFSEASET